MSQLCYQKDHNQSSTKWPLDLPGLVFRKSIVSMFLKVFNLDGHQHGTSIQIFITLGKKVSLHILHKKIAVTETLTRVFTYFNLPSFFSQILTLCSELLCLP